MTSSSGRLLAQGQTSTTRMTPLQNTRSWTVLLSEVNDEAFYCPHWVVKCVSVGRFCLNVLLAFGASGESIPIRLFMAGYEMTPTMRDINKKFSVRYYLNLVLIDEEERRYFKQQVCWTGKQFLLFLQYVDFHSVFSYSDLILCCSFKQIR